MVLNLSQNQVLLVPLIIPEFQVQYSNPGFGAVRKIHWSLLATIMHYEVRSVLGSN